MQVIRMKDEELRRYLRSMLGRVLKDAPNINFPPPIPVTGDPKGNWTLDLNGVEMFGYEDLVGVVIQEARQAIRLKTD
jgi:hypothetical protein